jgi:hypothetical protein
MWKLKPKRIRFSLRLLLVITAAFAVALYVMYVRPTQTANHFVVAVMRHDYSAAKTFLMDDESLWLDDETDTVDQIHAEVLPREWDDICKCQRKIIVRVARHEEEDGRRVDWTSDIDLVARFDGRVIATPVIDFSQMKCGVVELIELPAYNEPFRIPNYTLVP